MKKVCSMAVVLTMVASLAACGASSTPQETAPYATIVDHAGREVVLEAKAERIVSGYFITTSALIALGLEDQLVGIENKANTRPIYALSAPQLLEVPGVGTAKEFDIEGTLALEPDLVVLPIRLLESAETLAEMGVDVLCVNPENDIQLAETVEMLAQATGTQTQADALMTRASETLADLGDLLAEEETPTVYFASQSDLLSTAGTQMYQHTLIEQAHAQNVAADITDTYWAAISYEQLLAYDPDYIILAPAASYEVEQVVNDPALQSLRCVEAGRVYKMPYPAEAWDCPMPSAYLGALWMASMFHEDCYTAEQFREETTNFYATFYDCDVAVGD